MIIDSVVDVEADGWTKDVDSDEGLKVQQYLVNNMYIDVSNEIDIEKSSRNTSENSDEDNNLIIDVNGENHFDDSLLEKLNSSSVDSDSGETDECFQCDVIVAKRADQLSFSKDAYVQEKQGNDDLFNVQVARKKYSTADRAKDVSSLNDYPKFAKEQQISTLINGDKKSFVTDDESENESERASLDVQNNRRNIVIANESHGEVCGASQNATMQMSDTTQRGAGKEEGEVNRASERNTARPENENASCTLRLEDDVSVSILGVDLVDVLTRLTQGDNPPKITVLKCGCAINRKIKQNEEFDNSNNDEEADYSNKKRGSAKRSRSNGDRECEVPKFSRRGKVSGESEVAGKNFEQDERVNRAGKGVGARTRDRFGTSIGRAARRRLPPAATRRRQTSSGHRLSAFGRANRESRTHFAPDHCESKSEHRQSSHGDRGLFTFGNLRICVHESEEDFDSERRKHRGERFVGRRVQADETGDLRESERNSRSGVPKTLKEKKKNSETFSNEESCGCNCSCHRIEGEDIDVSGEIVETSVDENPQLDTIEEEQFEKPDTIVNESYDNKHNTSKVHEDSDKTNLSDNDSLEYLSSKSLNYFEFSARLKRLEGKLISSASSEVEQKTSENNQETFDLNENSLSNHVKGISAVVGHHSNEKNKKILRTDGEKEYYSEKLLSNQHYLKDENIYPGIVNDENKANECCGNDNVSDAEISLSFEKPSTDSFNKKYPVIGDDFDDIDSDPCSETESKELEEFERQERWATNEEYFKINANQFSSSSCQFDASNVAGYGLTAGDTDQHLECYDELLEQSDEDWESGLDEETEANTQANMRGDQPALENDRRHNKDFGNLKSLLKKVPKAKGKKNRVIFNENNNEFFEADYIILIREECQYDEESDEGVCTCSQHEMVRLACCEGGCEGQGCAPPADFVDQVTLSPPEGYKDSGLFNRDGTFRDQSFFAREGPGLLVSEGSGAVFTPQHLRQLQVIQRLQREQLRRARAALSAEGTDLPEIPNSELFPDVSREPRPTNGLLEDLGFEIQSARNEFPASIPNSDGGTASGEEDMEEQDTEESLDEASSQTDKTAAAKGSYAKEIVAGEERPKVNSGQQTTPTDEVQRYVVETISMTTQSERRIVREAPATRGKDDDDDSQSDSAGMDGSPMRLGGILKGGRLWKSTIEGTPKIEPPEQLQVEECTSFSNQTSDEEGRGGRAVRFSEPPPRDPCDGEAPTSAASLDEQQSQHPSQDQITPKELTLTFRLGNHILSNNSLRPNSAVRQLFPAGPHFVSPPTRQEADKQYLVTAESLRAFEEAKRSRLPSTYREEDMTLRKTIDRNILRRSLVKVDPRKKTPQKNDTSLSERIKMLTCNIEDEDHDQEVEIESERGSPSGEEARTLPIPPAKSFSPSSSSSSASSCSSTSSAYKKLTEIFPKRQDRIPECSEEGNGVLIIPQGETTIGGEGRRQSRTSLRPGERSSHSSVATDYSIGDIDAVLDQPAPDVIAGTPGAGDGDELARFVQQEAARTERLRKRYSQQASADNSDEDDQDDYGFQRRPSVRGIKPRFGSTNEILQQMQSQLMPPSSTAARPGHISWPYYSESNLTQPAPHDHILHHQTEQAPNRSSIEDFQQNLKLGSAAEQATCFDLRNHNVPEHRHHAGEVPRQQDDNIYQNCVTYANVRCNGGDRDLYTKAIHTYARGHRRPESPPPIRSYHQTMVLIPYTNLHHQPHYSNTIDRQYHVAHSTPGDQNGSVSGYQQQQAPIEQQSNLLKMNQGSQQMVSMPFPQTGVPMQITCSAPMARLRTVPARPVARHMICYSEKVQAPLYQAAPGSPGTPTPATVRGAPEGAPAPAASPTAPHPYPHPHTHQHHQHQQQHSSVYYAMNV